MERIAMERTTNTPTNRNAATTTLAATQTTQANRGSGYGKRRPAWYPIKLPGGSTQRRVDDPQGVDQGDGSTSTAPDPAQPRIDNGARQPIGSTDNQ